MESLISLFLTQRSMRYCSAKRETISSAHPLPSSPRKILSPPKQLLKIHFYFMLTALLKLENVSEGFGCQCYLFPNPHLALKGLFPPLPERTPQQVVMDLATWERWCHLWDSTWHLQPSLPTCELPAQWVLRKWNGFNNHPGRRGTDWQMKFRSLMYYLQLDPVTNWISLSCEFRHKGTEVEGGYCFNTLRIWRANFLPIV